jgi:hypothetical protein
MNANRPGIKMCQGMLLIPCIMQCPHMKEFFSAPLLFVMFAALSGAVVGVFRLSDHPPAYSPARLVEAIREGRIAPGPNMIALGIKSRASHRRTNDMGIELITTI